jgi:hypothetical protein
MEGERDELAAVVGAGLEIVRLTWVLEDLPDGARAPARRIPGRLPDAHQGRRSRLSKEREMPPDPTHIVIPGMIDG